MSIQKAATILNILTNNLPVIAEANELGVGASKFMQGVLVRGGWQPADIPNVAPLLDALVEVVKQP